MFHSTGGGPLLLLLNALLDGAWALLLLTALLLEDAPADVEPAADDDTEPMELLDALLPLDTAALDPDAGVDVPAVAEDAVTAEELLSAEDATTDVDDDARDEDVPAWDVDCPTEDAPTLEDVMTPEDEELLELPSPLLLVHAATATNTRPDATTRMEPPGHRMMDLSTHT